VQEIAGLSDVAVWLHRTLPPIVQIRAGLDPLRREGWCCRGAMEAERRIHGDSLQLARLEALAEPSYAGD
jgi:hypothetical protein